LATSATCACGTTYVEKFCEDEQLGTVQFCLRDLDYVCRPMDLALDIGTAVLVFRVPQ
jgi:hypothetical protein